MGSLLRMRGRPGVDGNESVGFGFAKRGLFSVGVSVSGCMRYHSARRIQIVALRYLVFREGFATCVRSPRG